MTPEFIVERRSIKSRPMLVHHGGVSFSIPGSLAVFYRWAEGLGFLDEFWRDTKPYWWKYYIDALNASIEADEQKERDHEQYMEQRKLWQNEKRRQRRLREKENSVPTPENAVSPVKA